MTKDEYADIYIKYYDMTDDELQNSLRELYNRRYTEHDIEVFTEHRIAARVQLERNRSTDSLIFHMKELQVKKSC